MALARAGVGTARPLRRRRGRRHQPAPADPLLRGRRRGAEGGRRGARSARKGARARGASATATRLLPDNALTLVRDVRRRARGLRQLRHQVPRGRRVRARRRTRRARLGGALGGDGARRRSRRAALLPLPLRGRPAGRRRAELRRGGRHGPGGRRRGGRAGRPRARPARRTSTWPGSSSRSTVAPGPRGGAPVPPPSSNAPSAAMPAAHPPHRSRDVRSARLRGLTARPGEQSHGDDRPNPHPPPNADRRRRRGDRLGRDRRRGDRGPGAQAPRASATACSTPRACGAS